MLWPVITLQSRLAYILIHIFISSQLNNRNPLICSVIAAGIQPGTQK